ncbi:autotransporter outer membrane beta-barrel domain-containing protein [Methylotenera versatilis]|uniref:autotransporter outer membrane beta-barrel domain-containing protein n=1 Tax=Methylotenera versatilis TaxID=1055487 RepID=UPI00068B143E|nr:autotransporter outer membrane beta-barrel domain-containing protein [Methylotenera versatilis]
MNRSYRSVWNVALGAWVAVSEITRTCGKRGSATVVANALPLLVGVALASALPANAADYNTGAGTTQVEGSILSGADALDKQGAGTLEMTGINTYTGVTTINAGTLSLTGAGSIAQSSKVVANGTFDISGITSTGTSIKSLSGSNTGIVNLGTKTLTITNASDTYAGNINGTGNLTLNGGTQTLTGTSDVHILTVNAGELRLTDGAQMTITTTAVNDNAVIAGSGGAAAVMTVIGPTTTLNMNGPGTVWVGTTGNTSGVLNIGAGAQVSLDSLNSGRAVSSGFYGVTNVSGAGTLLDAGSIQVGGAASGGSRSEVNVSGGATVLSDTHSSGTAARAGVLASTTLSGTGTNWTNTGALSLYSGSLDVLDGATYQTNTARIGGYNLWTAAHTALLNVTGGGSSFTSIGDMNVGTTNTTRGDIRLSNDGKIEVDGNVVLGQVAGSTGVLNIGGAEGGIAQAAGTWVASNVNFGPGTGRINFNHTGAAFNFNSIISGLGTINQNGSGLTTLTANSSAFTGITNVNAGTLSVNGILGGTMQVNGGRLQGIGQVGDTTNFAGGTIAPGNSIGTLLIAGNYIGSGGVLEMEAVLAGTGSPADRLLISGNATGNTVVNVINTGGAGALTGASNTDGISIIQVGGTSTASTFQLAGGYAVAGPYQYILKAFDPATSAAGEVDPLLGATPFWDYRLQSLIDSSGNPVAVPQVAGYQAMPTGAVRYGASLLDSVHKRLGELRETATLQNKIGSTEQRSKEVFLRTQGSSSDVSGNSASGYDQDIWYVQAGGNLFGRDMADGAELRIGGALSIGGSKLNADESSAKVDLRGTTLALTSTYQAAAGWYLDAVAQGTRYTSEITTSQRGETGDPKGWGWGLSLEGGYPFDMGNGLIVEPQAQLSYQRIRFDKFTDIDSIDVDLNGGESLRGRFGGRVLKTITTNIDRQWTPYVEANLLHEFLSDGSITASNVRFDSESMGTSLQFGGGLNARLGLNSSVFASLSYEKGLTSASADVWGGNVGVRVDF